MDALHGMAWHGIGVALCMVHGAWFGKRDSGGIYLNCLDDR